MTKSETAKDQAALSATSFWQTTIASTSATASQDQVTTQAEQTAKPKKTKKARRPTDPEDEFFYEQAKFFRHLERRYDRFVKHTQEDEKRARQGKLKVRKSKVKEENKVQQTDASPTNEFKRSTNPPDNKSINRMSGSIRRAVASASAPVAGSSRQLSTTVPRSARGSSKKRVVNPDAMELSEATRILRALEIGNPSSAYSVTLQTHHSKSSLPLRGRVSLPLDARRAAEVILVFSEPNSPSSSAAKSAGAHIIGGEELFAKVLSGEIQPTKVLTTPSMLPAVQRQLARFLGPKGLMPSPKRGGVGEGEELGNRIREAGGTLEWKADKLGVIRAPVARMTFDLPAVQTNIRAFIAAVREQAAMASAAEQSASSSSRGRKPSGIVTARLETTHGPSIEINDV